MIDLPKLYPITDTSISGLSHYEQAKRMIEGGAKVLQVRDKNALSSELFNAVVEVCALAEASGVKVLVNDRVDIALAAGASGVHLGQDDLPPEEARKLLGPDAIIGFSTHSVEQAVAASSLPVDYIAIGPVFATYTKEDPEPVVGTEGVTAVREQIGDLPLVAIGGITYQNFYEVLQAGADSVAVISGILRPPDLIASKVSEFLQAANKLCV